MRNVQTLYVDKQWCVALGMLTPTSATSPPANIRKHKFYLRRENMVDSSDDEVFVPKPPPNK